MKQSIQKNGKAKDAAAKFKRKRIQCPKCRSRIIDSSLSTVAEIRVLSENSRQKADFYIKCYNCNSELAIRKLG